jgi:hypothetical protein
MTVFRKIKSANLLRCAVVVHTDAEAQRIRDAADELGLPVPRIVRRPFPEN